MTNMTNLFYLRDWVEKYLPRGVVLSEPIFLDPLNGDAGFRQYFRVNSNPSLIAVLAPPLLENNFNFVNISSCFREGALHTPLVYAVDYQSGFLLLEDLGDHLLLPLLAGKNQSQLYDFAEIELIKIQKISKNKAIFPEYSRQELLKEMTIFIEWFVRKLLNIELSPADLRLLDDAFSIIAESALEQPQVVVHRDFHSRNLMQLPDGSIGVIDFQDAVIGPITYDMVSLFRDCYIRLPKEYVVQRALNCYQQAVDAGIAPKISDNQVIRWFDLMGLQRHIKVLGIFSRLHLRDEKHDYLDDLSLVIRYILEQLRPYPELKNFTLWFEQYVLPEVSRQPWFQSLEAAGEISATSSSGD